MYRQYLWLKIPPLLTFFCLHLGETEILLPMGTHSYPFQFQLPVGMPTSWEGGYGYIRYTVRVNVNEPLCPKQEFEVPFTVIKPVNLNLDRTLCVSDVTPFICSYEMAFTKYDIESLPSAINFYFIL